MYHPASRDRAAERMQGVFVHGLDLVSEGELMLLRRRD